MNRFVLAASISLAAMASTPALAQNSGLQENAEQQDTIPEGDIIVTANRTETLLSNTPIAITAIGGDDLTQSGITNPTQLEDVVPNLSIIRGNGLQITIRGVTSADGTEKGDPSAAFNLNGIYIARPQQQEVSFFDIERVEVLRGPQGTLYGRNATAGVVNVITSRPEFDFGASLDVDYGNFDSLFATGVVNVGFGEGAAFRLAGNLDRHDSYVIDGAPNDGVDYGRFKDNRAARLSALFEPTEDLTVYVVWDYSNLRGNAVNGVPGTNFYDATGVGAGEFATYIDTNDDAQRTNPVPFVQQPMQDSENFGITGEIEYVFGDASITYLGGYRDSDTDFVGVLSNGARGFDQRFLADQQSHELRLAYGAGPLQAQVGGYYFREESDQSFNINLATGPGAARLSFLQNPTIARSQAVFGQLTYELVENLRVTGGVRYSDDRKSRQGQGLLTVRDNLVDSSNLGSILFQQQISNNDADVSFDKVTWRVGVDYDTELGLIYATVSTGYKAGGFNDGCAASTGIPQCTVPDNFLFYNPETLTAYEAGFKFRFGPMFALNGTVFHYDYSNLQLTQLVQDFGGPGINAQITTNAASADINGVELDATIRPIEGLSIFAALNWLDASYASFNPGRDLSGRPLLRSPEWSGRLALDYVVPVGDGDITFNVSSRFSDSYDLSNDFTNFIFYEQPSFTKTDASVRYTAPGEAFYVAAYVENIEDDLVLTSGSTTAAIFSAPRTYGVRAGVEF